MSASTGYGLCDSCSETARPSLAAAKEGHIECLIFACDSLGLAHDRDGYGATPLHFAARHGHLSCLQWLVDHSTISSTVVTRGGTTAAHDAAATGNIECLKFLLNNTNCLLEHRTVDGSTMLHMACRFGKLAMIKWLVSECDVSPNEMGVNDVTPVHICSAKGHLQCLRWLTSYLNYIPNMETIHGATPTYFAAQEGCLQSLEWLIDHAQGDPKHPAKDGMLPIHASAQAGHLDCLKWLISKGLNTVNELSADGGTPIHFAAAGGHVDALSWLIINGGNVNSVDYCRSTPLHDAAQQNQPRTLKLLVESGASIDVMDDECYTPLDLAVDRSATECIEILSSLLKGTCHTNSFDSPKESKIEEIEQERGETLQVVVQNNAQRDFELLLSPSFEETDHPKSLRRSKFNKFISWKNRLARSNESKGSKKKKLSRKNSLSDSNDHLRKQKDNNDKEAYLDGEIFDQDITYSPLYKDLLINPKSPEVIRVVRPTNEILDNQFTHGDEKQFNEELPNKISKIKGDKIILERDLEVKRNFNEMVIAETEKAKASISFENNAQETLMESHEAKKFDLNSWLQYQSKLNELQTKTHIYDITETNEEYDHPPQTTDLPKSIPLKSPTPSRVMQAIEIFSQDLNTEFPLYKKPPPPPILPKPINFQATTEATKILLPLKEPATEHTTISSQCTLLISARENLNKVSTKDFSNNEFSYEEKAETFLDQKKINSNILERLKTNKITYAESASSALLGPPLLGQRRINRAFIGLNTGPGLVCWKLGASLKHMAEGSALDGHMNTTDIYLYLYTSVYGPVYHQIHLWIGLKCDMDRFAKAAISAHELTDSLSGLSQVSKETQGLESERFLSYFKKRTFFYHQTTSHKLFSKTCLYEVSGTHFYRCAQVSTSIDRFSDQKSFILLSQKTIYLWTGTQAPECLKVNALQIALSLREKLEMTSFLLVSPTQNFDRFQSTIRIIERDELRDFTSTIQNIKTVNFQIRYYQANSKFQTKLRDYIETQYNQYLFSSDKVVFIIIPAKLIVWVGQRARTPGYEYLKLGQEFLKCYFYPEHLPVVVIYEYGECDLFDNLFPDRIKPDFSLLHSNYLKELNIKPKFESSMHDAGLGKTVIYEVHRTGIDYQHTNAFGHFDSSFCYIILYSYRRNVKFISILYVWIGSDVTNDILRNTDYQLREINKSIKGETAEVYIPQGMETDHFLSIFKAKFICFRKSCCRNTHNGSASLFRIFSYNLLSLKAVQVDTIATSLLSNSAFVMIADTICIVWIGQTATQNDRRGTMFIAKSLKPQEPVVLLEGEENERFWRLLGGRNRYSPIPEKQWQLRNGEPKLYLFSKTIKSLFIPIPNFKQEDLYIESIFLLDLGCQLFIWRGSKAEEIDYRLITSEYLTQISTERTLENTILNIIYQGSELSTFVRHFKDWDDDYWGKPSSTYEEEIKKTVILKQPPPSKGKVDQTVPNPANHILKSNTIETDLEIENYFETQAMLLDNSLNFQNEPLEPKRISPSINTTDAKQLANEVMEEISDLDKVLASFDVEVDNSLKELNNSQQKRESVVANEQQKRESVVANEQQNDDFNFESIIRDLDLALLSTTTSKLHSNHDATSFNFQYRGSASLKNIDFPFGHSFIVGQNMDQEKKLDELTVSHSEVDHIPKELSTVPEKPTSHQKSVPQYPVTSQLSDEIVTQAESPSRSPKLKTKKQISKKGIKEKGNKKLSSKILNKKSVQHTTEHKSVFVFIEKSKNFVSIICEKTANTQNFIDNLTFKLRVKLTSTMFIFERIVQNNLERKLEAHEFVLDIVHSWPQPQLGNIKDRFLLVLKEFNDKFDLIGYILSVKDVESIIKREKTIPELQGEVFLNKTSPSAHSGNTWISTRLQYQDDGIYKIINEKDKELVVKFSGAKVYKLYRKEAAESIFPTKHCFIIRPKGSWDTKDFYTFSTTDEQQLAHWVGYVRVGIFGLHLLYEDWQYALSKVV